jgi:hypothetical protein
MHCRLSSLCSVGLGSQVGRMSRIEEACLTGVVHLTLVKLAIGERLLRSSSGGLTSRFTILVPSRVLHKYSAYVLGSLTMYCS